MLYENISLDVREEIWLAKEAVIKLCQEELKNNLKKIRQQYYRLDVYIDDRGVVRSGGRLDKSNLPDEIKRLIIVSGQHLLAHLMAEHYHQKLILNPWDMLKVAEKQVTKFWDIWMRHIPPQLLFPNKWFRSRDNLKVGDFVINLQPGMKKMQLYPEDCGKRQSSMTFSQVKITWCGVLQFGTAMETCINDLFTNYV